MAELKRLSPREEKPGKSDRLDFTQGFSFGLGFFVAAIVISALPFIACFALTMYLGILGQALSR